MKITASFELKPNYIKVTIPMRLAAIYNVFDGEELLEKSVQSVRSNVDYVIAITQTLSNWHQYYKGGLNEAKRLYKLGLIDEVINIEPKGRHPQAREIYKREYGLKQAKAANCTHFLHMDCDEVYNSKDFENAKTIIEGYDYKATACKIQSYYKWEYKTKELDRYYVPFICQLPAVHSRKFPVYCDPTRSCLPNTPFYEFSSDELVMHHYTWCRNNIELKFSNSTARMNGDYQHLIDKYNAIELGYMLDGWNEIVEI